MCFCLNEGRDLSVEPIHVEASNLENRGLSLLCSMSWNQLQREGFCINQLQSEVARPSLLDLSFFTWAYKLGQFSLCLPFEFREERGHGAASYKQSIKQKMDSWKCPECKQSLVSEKGLQLPSASCRVTSVWRAQNWIHWGTGKCLSQHPPAHRVQYFNMCVPEASMRPERTVKKTKKMERSASSQTLAACSSISWTRLCRPRICCCNDLRFPALSLQCFAVPQP